MKALFDPTVNTKYCPHTSCTNSVINVISDGLQLIVIAVDTHASQFEFLITKSLMISTYVNCNIPRIWHILSQPLEIQMLKSL